MHLEVHFANWCSPIPSLAMNWAVFYAYLLRILNYALIVANCKLAQKTKRCIKKRNTVYALVNAFTKIIWSISCSNMGCYKPPENHQLLSDCVSFFRTRVSFFQRMCFVFSVLCFVFSNVNLGRFCLNFGMWSTSKVWRKFYKDRSNVNNLTVILWKQPSLSSQKCPNVHIYLHTNLLRVASRFNNDWSLITCCFVTNIMKMTAASIGLSAKHLLRCLNAAQFIGRSALRCVLLGIKSIFDWHLDDADP